MVISDTDATPDLMTPDISDVFDSDLEAYLFDIPPLPSPIDSSNIINAQETCGSGKCNLIFLYNFNPLLD